MIQYVKYFFESSEEHFTSTFLSYLAQFETNEQYETQFFPNFNIFPINNACHNILLIVRMSQVSSLYYGDYSKMKSFKWEKINFTFKLLTYYKEAC